MKTESSISKRSYTIKTQMKPNLASSAFICVDHPSDFTLIQTLSAFSITSPSSSAVRPSTSNTERKITVVIEGCSTRLCSGQQIFLRRPDVLTLTWI